MKQIEERFWSKVDKSAHCWNWNATRTPGGYGLFRVGKLRLAHRVAYELAFGKLPTNKVIDHLCRNRLCVNPKHMELVNQRENILRGNGLSAVHAKKTACIHGHAFSVKNTYMYKTAYGIGRSCRQCAAVKSKRYRDKQIIP